LLDLLELVFDSIDSIEWGLLVMEVSDYYDKIIILVKEFIFFIQKVKFY
jgi:hypothetical protein